MAALLLIGCHQMQEVGGGEHVYEDLEIQIADAVAVDSSGDTDGSAPFEDDFGGAYDPETGLVWQNPALDDLLMWQEAMEYCAELVHGGYDDWRLPDVDELQTLLRGCPGAEDCGVDDPECLTSDCNDGPNCGGCEDWEGPTTDGCYTVGYLEGWCELYWSRSPAVPGVYRFWLVDFVQAKTPSDEIGYANGVRCIRGPE
jgi:hypothetical protein